MKSTPFEIQTPIVALKSIHFNRILYSIVLGADFSIVNAAWAHAPN